MKKVSKKIGIILTTVLVVLVSLLFIGAAYLFLVPNSSLFGISYISRNELMSFTVGEYTSSSLSEIEISSARFDIIVVPDDTDNHIKVYVRDKVNGFAMKSKSTTRLEQRYDESSKLLALSLIEPEGLIGANNSSVKLVVPQSLMKNGISLNVKTHKKTDISINGAGVTNLKTLNVTINRGNFNFDGLIAENIYIKANKAKIKAGKDVSGVVNYMQLDINNSQIQLLYAGEGEKYLKERVPEIDAINFSVNNLVIKSARKSSSIKLFNCVYLYNETGCIAEGGQIELFYLKKANFNSKDLNVVIYKFLEDQNESIFNFSGKGSILVRNNYSNAAITTNSGNINIDMSSNILSLETVSGNINVKEAKQPVSVITKSGNAQIEFSLEDENAKRQIVLLRAESGNIEVKNVDTANVVVPEEAKPTITLFYNKVTNQNSIDSKNANVNIVVPIDIPLQVQVIGDNAYLQVDVGTVTRENDLLNGDFDFLVYSEINTTNKLIINSSGNIKLFSEDIYELKK